MRTSRWLLISALGSLFCTLLIAAPGCSDNADNSNKPECSDGKDNDGDGMIDFPDDLGCHGPAVEGNVEADAPAAQCNDGRDNDGDGKHDFPNDPGCFAPNQDDESDDCPDGPQCPQCSNGIDDDMNGQTDFPEDSGGCDSASDGDEYTRNPVACGTALVIQPLPFDGHITGTLDSAKPSTLTSPTCGGAGPEAVYELRVNAPKVIVATSDTGNTAADTVLYIRTQDCQNASSELVCSDDISATNNKSSVTKAVSTPGLYFLVVDSHDSTTTGAYDIQVKFLAGEGVSCSGIDDCGPGLVCRVPKNQTAKVCSKHVCEDTVDEDGDGKNGYPDDPGCTSPTDDDETDGCPGVGPNCPECADGVDNDSDGKTDFGTNGDTTCSSASSASEACLSTDGVVQITAPMTMDTTVGANNDVKPACASSTGNSPDKTFRLDVPAMADLTIDSDAMTFDGVAALYNATCAGTAIQCSDTPETVSVTGLAAGTYYYVIDGWGTSAMGSFPINVSGHIQNGQSCESALAQSGAITCLAGSACAGAPGSRICQPAACSDGMDNDSDGKIDFPFDPGCTDGADQTEGNPTTAPVCADGIDNDAPADGLVDFPADFGCNGASGTSEAFCTGETDPSVLITQKVTMGTTTAKANDWPATTCQTTSTAPDIAFGLELPVNVQTLTISTDGSGFDTVIQLRDPQCATMIACDDDGGSGVQSMITRTSIAAGSYAVIVDGYSSGNGAVTLNVNGTVAPGTLCGFPAFMGANAYLACPTGTTCTGTPAKCQ